MLSTGPTEGWDLEGHSERMRPSQIFHSFLLHPVPSGRGQGAFHVEDLRVGGRGEQWHRISWEPV